MSSSATGPIEFPELHVRWCCHRDQSQAVMRGELYDQLTSIEFLLLDMTEVIDAEPANAALRFCYDLRLARGRDIANPIQMLMSLAKALRRFEPGAVLCLQDQDFASWRKELGELAIVGMGGTRSLVLRDPAPGPQGARVLKAYHASAAAFYETDCGWMARLQDLPGTCQLIARDDDRLVITMAQVQPGWKWRDRGWNLYPVDRAQQIIRYLQALHERNVYMVDWNPGSFLFDDLDRLHVIDFEFAYAGDAIPADYEENLDWQGGPHNVAIPGCDSPSYEVDWQPITGLAFAKLMHAGRAELMLRRIVHRLVRRWPGFLLRLPNRLFRPAKTFLRSQLKSRRQSGATYFEV